MSGRRPGDGDGLGDAVPGLVVLALATFSALTTEMVPVGLLPTLSRAFGVRESVAGLLVTLYAGLVAVLSVPITWATRRIPRKPLLLACAGSYALSNAICAAAPSFAAVAVGRGLAGVTHALYFSVAIGYAARLVPAEKSGRALALASAGASAGMVLGVPAATALGNGLGWRSAFVFLVVLLAVVMVLMGKLLPDVRPAPSERTRHRGSRRSMAAAASANALTYLGHYTAYTYVSVLLLAAGVGPSAIAPILLVFGALALVGVAVTGRQLDRRPRASALVIVGLMVLGVAATGASLPRLVLVVVFAAVWNGAFGPTASLFQNAAVRTDALSPEIAGAWINSTANIGIGGGAALGGLVMDGSGLHGVAWVGCAVLLVALALIAASRGAFPSSPRTGATITRDTP